MTCEACVPVHAFLAAETGKPSRLGHVAVVAREQHQFQVEPAQAYEAQDIVEADRGAPRFPAGDPRLRRASPGGQLGLGQISPSAGLTNQVATERTHDSHNNSSVMHSRWPRRAWERRDHGVMADAELDELFAAKPEDFTALRTKLAAAAKKRGDADTAKQISAARKPTTAAWVVNRLALGDTSVNERLSDLRERLRTAHAEMDGERIRELTGQQRRLVNDLTRTAIEEAELTEPSAALRDDVTGTLQAAVADPDVAARLGRLTKAERWSGFGEFGDTAMVFTTTRAKPKPRSRAEARAEA